MDGVTVPIEEPFVTPAGYRLMYSGDRSLGAPPGEVVNCRCTIVGARLEGTMQGVQQEQIQVGVHVLAASSVLSRSKTKQIFRAINTAGLEGFLREHPLARLDVVRVQMVGGRQINGEYDEQTRELWVNARRSEQTFAQPFRLGTTSSISALAPTLLAAIQRSLVHELAHHVYSRKIFATPLEGVVLGAAKLGTPLTFRASVGVKEYFAECFTAYVYERDLLQKHDPVGHAMIKRVREELGLP
ncbi:hypothetical protein [Meiothermus rufus]|uniref:hypothetical protein n=1 Tax=Meiothermus rufus TaxID=604332 RepID=UPI000482F648|nr:hypothetical protein [Meiothermus rufus]